MMTLEVSVHTLVRMLQLLVLHCDAALTPALSSTRAQSELNVK